VPIQYAGGRLGNCRGKRHEEKEGDQHSEKWQAYERKSVGMLAR